MATRVLNKKPLVEAIFEMRWRLTGQGQTAKSDPHYKLLVGQLYDKLVNEYPFHETLPAADLPDGLFPHVVQHRFRHGDAQWPLVQVGPGVVTLNDTSKYTWPDFVGRIPLVLDSVLGGYESAKQGIEITSLALRYIDAVDFDFESESIFPFLASKMRLSVEVPKDLFDGTQVSDRPASFDLGLSYPTTKPRGIVDLRFARGKQNEREALLWYTTVRTDEKQVVNGKEQIIEWLDCAHELTHDWFFKLIAGSLERSFE